MSLLLLADSAGPWRLTVMWPIVLPLVLGLIAIYLLLPRPRAWPAWWGSMVAALALLAGGWLLIWGKTAHPETILFFAFSGTALIFGGLLVTQRNPVHAALSFALVVLSTCGLFLLQAAPFLMAATIIVYAGAIVVTFLFVIMLAQQAGFSDADHRSREPELSTFAGFVLLGALLFLLQLTYDTQPLDTLLGRVDQGQQKIDQLVSHTQPDEANQSSPREVYHDVQAINWKGLFHDLSQEASRHAGSANFADVDEAIREAQSSWSGLEGELNRTLNEREPGQAEPKTLDGEGREKLEEMKNALTRLRQAGSQFRDTYGYLKPDAKPLSSFSGPPANVPWQDLHAGSPKGVPMPANNVAALGRSLFTDYLIPVELGGTLLLVATIGAIAIAGRRPEGWR